MMELEVNRSFKLAESHELYLHWTIISARHISLFAFVEVYFNQNRIDNLDWKSKEDSS